MRRQLFTLLTLLISFFFIFGLGTFNTLRSAGIPPELEQRFKSVKTLEITSSNRDVLWDLRKHPERAQVIELRLYAKELTLEQIDIVRTWLTGGRGVVIYATNNNHKHPPVRANRILNRLVKQKVTLERVSEFEFFAPSTDQTHSILVYAKHIKCSYSYGASGYKQPYVIHRNKETLFTSLFETKKGKPAVASWQLANGARVVYVGCDVSYPFKKYEDEYDNARFWANTILWLAHERIE